MKAPVRIKQAPANGYRMKEPSTGAEIYEQHPQAFINKIRKHREAMEEMGVKVDLEPGWQSRVWEEFCRQHPEIECREVGAPVWATTVSGLWRFGESLVNLLKGGAKLVDQEEAERRAAICASCPANKFSGAECPTCKGSLQWMFDLIAGRTTSKDSLLHSCSICSCALKIKVWWPKDAISDHELVRASFPDHCWARPQE